MLTDDIKKEDNEFLFLLEQEISRNLENNYVDNFDIDRFGELSRVAVDYEEKLASYYSYFRALNDLYGLLKDSFSKSLLIKIIAFRILGCRKFKLPLSATKYWDTREKIKQLADKNKFIPVDFMNWKLYLFDLNAVGFPIVLYSHPICVHAEFMLRQYEYFVGRNEIKAESEDVVIDAGGCWGDSALYFANEGGAGGKVYTFEFVHDNLVVLEKNMDLNPELKNRIQIVKNPLWDVSGKNVTYLNNGPGSAIDVCQTIGNVADLTISVDDFVKNNKLSKVNFVKMDIEGAELNVLKGAVNTMAQFRPKLAISLYHRIEDFIEIPAFLHSLRLGYEFYLGHYTTHSEETVLFAKSRS